MKRMAIFFYPIAGAVSVGLIWHSYIPICPTFINPGGTIAICLFLRDEAFQILRQRWAIEDKAVGILLLSYRGIFC